jgi:hypothetical protein
LPAAGIDCLLIGGFAVNHYGYTRHTLDVDLLVLSQRMDDVRRVMREAGFINIGVRDNAVFFSRPGEGPRVDFLPVDGSTLGKLLANAVPVMIGGRTIRVPALRDLLAMKIFSFSQDPARRMGKDLPDIAYLAVLHGLDFESDLRPLCERFGSDESAGLIQRQIEGMRSP